MVARVVALAASRTVVVAVVVVAAAAVHNLRRLVAADMKAVDQTSVSYTHLTLPTKRIV